MKTLKDTVIYQDILTELKEQEPNQVEVVLEAKARQMTMEALLVHMHEILCHITFSRF